MELKCDTEVLDLRATPSSESYAINKALKKKYAEYAAS